MKESNKKIIGCSNQKLLAIMYVRWVVYASDFILEKSLDEFQTIGLYIECFLAEKP